MRRGRIFIFLAFILILALIAVLFIWQRGLLPGQQAGQPTPTFTPVPVRVMIVTQDLRPGEPINEEIIAAIPWDPAALTDALFREEEKGLLIGRVAKLPIQSGLPVLKYMLLNEDEIIPMSGSPWALNVPRGSVAVSIPIDRLSGVSYAPRPGDRVDVVASMLFVDLDTDFQAVLPNLTGLVVASGPPDPETGKNDPLTVEITSLMQESLPDPNTGISDPPFPISPGVFGRVVIDPVLGQAVYIVPSEEQRPRLVSQMVLQNALVLQLGDFPLEEEEPTPTPVPVQPQEGQAQQVAPVPQPTGPPPPPKQPVVITLIVNPQEAIALNYLVYSGAKLTLTLRNPNDVDRFTRDAVTLQYLLEQYQIPVPVRLPYGTNPRIDELLQPTPAPQDPTPQQQ